MGRYPKRPELLCVLGEGKWHGEDLREGAATLERVVLLDPHWMMALHHSVDFFLAQGELDQIEQLAAVIKPVERSCAMCSL